MQNAIEQKDVCDYTDVECEEKIMQAIGEASMCWSNIKGAGVFESKKAKQIGKELVAYVRKSNKIADTLY